MVIYNVNKSQENLVGVGEYVYIKRPARKVPTSTILVLPAVEIRSQKQTAQHTKDDAKRAKRDIPSFHFSMQTIKCLSV